MAGKPYSTRKAKGFPDPDLPLSPTPFHFYSELSVRERRFVDNYVSCLDADLAARHAGLTAPNAYRALIGERRIQCAIRERQDAVSQLAGVTAADLRRQLKLVNDADATELAGIYKVPCRHCHGLNHQYQYTDAELYYVEQAYSYGESGWPFSCVTNEYGPILMNHAGAAYTAGKENHTLDLKGGGGYSRLREINPDCPQCHGHGEAMAYVCDTRHLSEGGRRLLKGIKINDTKFELLTVDRSNVLNILARDTQVGVERKEVVVSLPRTPDEFKRAVEHMSVADLEQFITDMVTLAENEYSELPPQPQIQFRRGN